MLALHRGVSGSMPDDNCGERSGTAEDLSSSFVWTFPDNHHSTIAPYSSLPARRAVQLQWLDRTLSCPRPINIGLPL